MAFGLENEEEIQLCLLPSLRIRTHSSMYSVQRSGSICLRLVLALSRAGLASYTK
jgi:hypothetical protein